MVRERYGARAKGVIELAQAADETADTACCSPSDVDRAMRLYNEGQLAGLPAESIAASAGCGNPTALAGLRAGERVLDLGSGGESTASWRRNRWGQRATLPGWT